MMRSNKKFLVLAAAVLALSACGKKAPSGQVVATVDKEEITQLDLQAEMGNFNSPDPKIRKQAQATALQQIISRKILAQAAKKQKIDRRPEYARMKQKADETLLIRTWQEDIVKQVPTPTPEEAVQFVNAHPELYANRQIYTVRQVRFMKPNGPGLLKLLQPATSIEEMTSILTVNKVPYEVSTTRLDMLAVHPRVAAQLAKLPPGEVFVLPAGAFLIANQLVDGQLQPVTGEAATKDAVQRLKTERTQDAVARQFQGIVNQGRSKVEYAKAYKPEAAPKAKAAAAPAPAAK